MSNEYLDKFEEAVQANEIFQYLAQLNSYKFGKGKPGYDWVPLYKEAYENGVILFAKTQSEKQEPLGKEIESVFRQMIQFDYLHEYLRMYLAVEAELRRLGKSPFQFDLVSLLSELQKVEALFKAQYNSEAKKNLKPDDIPNSLITGTEGRIVRLKDYLFHSGPSAQIPESPFLDHKGRQVKWP
jgi:hypothetical protein